MLVPLNVSAGAGPPSSNDRTGVDKIDPKELASGLKAVFANEAIAVRCPGYYSPLLAEEISTRLVRHPRFGHYETAPGIGKVGPPYYDTVRDPEFEAKYWANALEWIRIVRAAFWPYLSPIDCARLELDEQWPQGARLLRDAINRPAFAGLARVFEDGGEALPHVDRLEWDAPIGRFKASPAAQVAINVYMKIPAGGGELAIWRVKPDRRRYEELRIPGSYGLRRELLGRPDAVIEPQPGELILFDAQNVHAVYKSSGGPRVTISFFVVLSAEGQAFIYS